jgi:hypothetical protein
MFAPRSVTRTFGHRGDILAAICSLLLDSLEHPRVSLVKRQPDGIDHIVTDIPVPPLERRNQPDLDGWPHAAR